MKSLYVGRAVCGCCGNEVPVLADGRLRFHHAKFGCVNTLQITYAYTLDYNRDIPFRGEVCTHAAPRPSD